MKSKGGYKWTFINIGKEIEFSKTPLDLRNWTGSKDEIVLIITITHVNYLTMTRLIIANTRILD